MKISSIYKSKLPYQWRAGQYNAKAAAKARKKAAQRRKQGKKSAMGWMGA